MDDYLISFIQQSKDVVKEKKETYLNIEKEINEYIVVNFLKNIPMKNISINTRIKDENSLGEKIIRNKILLQEGIEPEVFVKNLKDIIGMRLICLLNSDEKKLYEEVKKIFNTPNEEISDFFGLETVDKDNGYLLINHNNQPEKQKNGKEIYKLECLWVENDQYTPVELQIKSLVHMFWGELEHKLIYKNYAYDEQQSFYKDIMNSINDLLGNIDSQLTTINTHVQEKGAKEQKIRAKEMLANELYLNLQNKINALLIDYDVDLREVYVLLSQLFSSGKNLKAIVQMLSIQFNNLQDITLSNENFTFSRDDLRIEGEESLTRFGEIISKLILSHDVVWKILFGIYHLLEQNETIRISFQKFVVGLYEILQSSIREKLAEANEVIDEEIVNRIIKPAISKGIINSFEIYLRMDFFIERKRLNTVIETTEEYINFLISHHENLESKEYSEIEMSLRDLLAQKLKIQLLLSLPGVVEVEELEDFKMKLQENKDWVFDLDYDSITEIYQSELTVDVRSKLVQFLNEKTEKGEGTENDQS